jgi:hypothetical protein
VGAVMFLFYFKISLPRRYPPEPPPFAHGDACPCWMQQLVSAFPIPRDKKSGLSISGFELYVASRSTYKHAAYFLPPEPLVAGHSLRGLNENHSTGSLDLPSDPRGLDSIEGSFKVSRSRPFPRRPLAERSTRS